MCKEILQRFDACPPSLFHRAQEEVFHLMRKDSLPRFIASEEFKAYLAEGP